MRDVIFEILYNSIDFKMMIKLRSVCRQIKKVYDQPHFWYIINITDISTRDTMELVDIFTKDRCCYMYNLSGKHRTFFKIPTTIMAKLKDTKLLIF